MKKKDDKDNIWDDINIAYICAIIAIAIDTFGIGLAIGARFF